MGLKEKANRFLDRAHTKKRWPYMVMVIMWFIIAASLSITIMLGTIGAFYVIGHWEEPGNPCVETESVKNDIATLGINTSGSVSSDYPIVDKYITVNATERSNVRYPTPGMCSPPAWLISLIIFNLDLTAYILLGITAVVWGLVIIRFIVWIRNWRRARKS